MVEFSPAIMNRKYKERRQLTLCRMTYSKDLGANGRAVVLGHVQTGLSGTASLRQRQPAYRQMKQETNGGEMRERGPPGRGNGKSRGPETGRGRAWPVRGRARGPEWLCRQLQLRGRAGREDRGGSTGVSVSQCFSRLLPQLGSPPLGDIDGCLSGGPPSPLPAPRNTCGVDRKRRPLPPSCPGGTPPSRPACPRRDRGPIEPALWTSGDNSHTEGQERRRHACAGSHQPVATPSPRLAALLTCSSGYLFQDDRHFQNGHFVFHLLPRGSLLCARPGDQRGIDMVSVPGERAGEETAGTQTKWSILSAGGAVAQCLPGRLIRKAS